MSPKVCIEPPHAVQKMQMRMELNQEKTKQQMSLLQRKSVFFGTNTTKILANETNTQCLLDINGHFQKCSSSWADVLEDVEVLY